MNEKVLEDKIKSMMPRTVFEATVVSVDKQKLTAKVKPVDGRAPYTGVRLRPDMNGSTTGCFIIPKVGSTVMCGMIDKGSRAMIIMSAEPESIMIKVSDEQYTEYDSSGNIIYNGGENGGMCITPELKAQLEKNNEMLEAILAVFAVPIPEPGNGAPSAFQAALDAATSTLQLGDFSNIENSKIKH